MSALLDFYAVPAGWPLSNLTHYGIIAMGWALVFTLALAFMWQFNKHPDYRDDIPKNLRPKKGEE